MRRRVRFRVALAAAAAVVVLAHAVTVQRAREDAAAELAAAESARAEAAAATAAVQARIDEVAARFAGARSRLAQVRATAEAHGRERDATDAANAAAQQQRDALDAADFSHRLATVADADRANLLSACLGTLEAAQGLLVMFGPAGATDTLRAGAESCRRAGPLADGGGTAGDSAYDFADPFVLVEGDRAWAYATNGPGGSVQVLTSRGLDGWAVAGDALAGFPAWARPGATWAPAVSRVGDGYVLYYSVREESSGRQCISMATAARPEGPFTDTSWWPAICQRELGGSIDPSPVLAPDGSRYLVWKSDGNARVGEGSHLWAQRLAPDGRGLEGEPAMLLAADQPWEARIVEAPSMTLVGGQWVLLYAGNRWDTPDYATGEARCAGPLGPCRKLADPVVLGSSDEVAGPGGTELFRDAGGGLHAVFHGWSPGVVGDGHSRRMFVRPAAVGADGRVRVLG